MDCLDIPMFLGFERHETHGVTSHRFGAVEVVLVGLQERLHEMHGDQVDLMAETDETMSPDRTP